MTSPHSTWTRDDIAALFDLPFDELVNAACTSRRTASPYAASALYRSYPDCMSSQSRAGVPRLAAIRNAVSGVMPRRPATISWMHCGGTRSFSAKALADRLRAANFSLSTAPGWICSNASWVTKNTSSMIIHNFNVFGIAVATAECQSPRPIDRHCPLTLPVPRQAMQTHRLERRNIVNRPRRLQNSQPRYRFGNIDAAALRFSVSRKTFGRAIGELVHHRTALNMDGMASPWCDAGVVGIYTSGSNVVERAADLLRSFERRMPPVTSAT